MIPIKHLSPFRRFCMTIGELPSSYVESLTYVELLTWLCDYLQNTVIPTVNNNAEAVTELQNLFVELETYVNTYLDSPEFLADVNAKLDEMATDGTFDQIINTNITGSLYNLETTDKDNLVDAINEVNSKVASAETHIGTLANLNTTSKTNCISAINEVNTAQNGVNTKVGDLTNLNTTDKTSVVNAINELVTNSRDIAIVSEYWDDSSATPKTVSYPTGFTRDNCIVVSSMWEDTDQGSYTQRRALAGDGIQVSLKADNVSILNTYAGGTVYVALMKVDFS